MGYSDHLTPYLHPPERNTATNVNRLFDMNSFLRSRDKYAADFFRRFTETQCFNRFIEERSFLSERSVYNIFFDDSVHRVDEAAAQGVQTPVSLLDASAFIANRTFVVPPPELLSGPTLHGFSYDGFPTRFRHHRFETELVRQAQMRAAVVSPPSPLSSLRREESEDEGGRRADDGKERSLAS